jgi:hypothetical protein
VRERADALFIAGDAFFYSRGVQLATLAVRERLGLLQSICIRASAGLKLARRAPYGA